MHNFRNRVVPTAVALLITATAFAQSGVSKSGGADSGISANDLVRAVIANELKPAGADPTRWRYEVSKEQDGHTQMKEVVETRDGVLERLISMDGRSLSVQKQEEEKERIKNLISHPQEQQKVEQSRRKDGAQCEAFFRMLPDAFIFNYAGREGDLIKLSFKPNPGFQPPSREARVFHAMEGEMLVQGRERRLAAMSGWLVEEVKFGGGWLGHLERGGKFHVERKSIAPGHWEMTAMEISMRGKVLFLKTIAVQQKESWQNFRKIDGNPSLADAAEMLDHPVILAAGR